MAARTPSVGAAPPASTPGRGKFCAHPYPEQLYLKVCWLIFKDKEESPDLALNGGAGKVGVL